MGNIKKLSNNYLFIFVSSLESERRENFREKMENFYFISVQTREKY